LTRPVRHGRWVAGLLATVLLGSAAFARCSLERIASLPVDVTGNRPTIAGEYAGHPVKLLVDTGANVSFVTPTGAARLGLSVEAAPGDVVYGVGGKERIGATWIGSLAFGQLRIRHVQMPVVRLPLAPHGKAPDFVIGHDVFAQYAMELDFPDGKLRLWQPHDCAPAQIVYWTQNYSMAKLEDAGTGVIHTTLLLDGKPVSTTFDTGATASWITQRELDALAIPTEAVERDATVLHGIDGQPIPSETVTLGTLALGDNETVRNVKLRVGHLFARDQRSTMDSRIPRRFSGQPEMLIGSDFFRSHRVMVWFHASRMFFSYQGGPIFQTIASPR
jgi:predicted aspartyl protease